MLILSGSSNRYRVLAFLRQLAWRKLPNVPQKRAPAQVIRCARRCIIPDAYLIDRQRINTLNIALSSIIRGRPSKRDRKLKRIRFTPFSFYVPGERNLRTFLNESRL